VLFVCIVLLATVTVVKCTEQMPQLKCFPKIIGILLN